jgi:hypothetical protein
MIEVLELAATMKQQERQAAEAELQKDMLNISSNNRN